MAAGLPSSQVDTQILLSFMEFLCQNGHSKPNIANYMAAVRTLFILHGFSTESFRDQRIQLYLKALKINAPFQPTIRSTLDIQKLQSLLKYCDSVPYSMTFKPLYLTCFFSFLRLSNILPHSVATFDYTRHLARGDFIKSGEGAVLLLKWSKTIQDRKSTVTIPLPSLGASPLCPIKALDLMIQNIPADPNHPLFLIKTPEVWSHLQTPLRASILKKNVLHYKYIHH